MNDRNIRVWNRAAWRKTNLWTKKSWRSLSLWRKRLWKRFPWKKSLWRKFPMSRSWKKLPMTPWMFLWRSPYLNPTAWNPSVPFRNRFFLKEFYYYNDYPYSLLSPISNILVLQTVPL